MGEPPNDFREGDRDRPDSRPEKGTDADETKPWRAEGLPPPKPNRPRINWWRFALTMALTYAAFFIISSFFDGEPRQTISYTEFTRQVNSGNVKDIYATGMSVQGNLKKAQPIPGDKQKDTFTKFSTVIPVFANQEQIFQQLSQQNVTIQAEPVGDQRGTFWNLVLSLLPILLLAGVWIWLMRRAGGMMSGGSGGIGGIGRNRAAKPVETGKVRVDFSDVAGIDEVENELIEIVDYLKEPGKYRRLGAKLPKGVLLTGPPGTGKTLLARAVAGRRACRSSRPAPRSSSR